MWKQATNILVSASGDHALRVVRSGIGQLREMLVKMDACYDFKSTVARYLRWSSSYQQSNRNCRRICSRIPISSPAWSSNWVQWILNCPIRSRVVSSWHRSRSTRRKSLTASIKTLADDQNWEEVASRLVEKWTSLRHDYRSSERSSAVHDCCGFCGKFNHKTESCFLNPTFLEKKLGSDDGVVHTIVEKGPPHRKNHLTENG